jgi:hypothetical protein
MLMNELPLIVSSLKTIGLADQEALRRVRLVLAYLARKDANGAAVSREQLAAAVQQ